MLTITLRGWSYSLSGLFEDEKLGPRIVSVYLPKSWLVEELGGMSQHWASTIRYAWSCKKLNMQKKSDFPFPFSVMTT